MDADAELQFRQFVETRSLALRKTAYALSGDVDVADDLVQSALTKLAGRWKRVDDPEGYVRRIIYNDQISRWRHRGVIREDPSERLSERGTRDSSADVNLRLDVQEALLRLGPRQRAVLVLRFYEDLPDSQIAATLGCAVGTVRSQISRALARLRVLAPELDASKVPAEEG